MKYYVFKPVGWIKSVHIFFQAILQEKNARMEFIPPTGAKLPQMSRMCILEPRDVSKKVAPRRFL